MSGPLTLLKKLQADSRRYLSALSPEQKGELAAYQEGSWINDVLRRGREKDVHKRHIATLDEIIGNAPRLPEDLRVYRGATPGVYPAEERGYLSTTLKRNIARDWPTADTGGPGELYTIDVPGDTPFLMPLDVVEEYLHQQELIFPRGSMLLREPSTGALNYLRGKYATGGRV